MNLHRALLAVVLSLATAPALAQEKLVPIKGVVSGSPESVTFAGNAKVSSRYAPDPDFGKPRLILTIDLTSVAGAGSSSGAKYVISGPEVVHRPAAASHAVEITFPFRNPKSPTTATPRTGVASFALDFDGAGALAKASGNVSSPNFPR